MPLPTPGTTAGPGWATDLNNVILRGHDTEGRDKGIINVKEHGAVGDGTTNDTVVLQGLIDAVTTPGAVLFFPPGRYRANLILRSGVQLTSLSGTWGRLFGTWYAPVIIQGVTSDWVITTPATNINTAVIDGINILGVDTTTAVGGVLLQDAANCTFRRMCIHGFQGPGMRTVAGNPNIYEDMLLTACLLNRAQAAPAGVFELGGADHFVTRVEANAGIPDGGTVTVNQNCNAFLISCAQGQFVQCVGELSDRGWYITGSNNRFVGCRSDKNFGHGWEIRGGANAFAGCASVTDGRSAVNTYSGFRLDTSNAQNNTFAGCKVNQAAGTGTVKYCFEEIIGNAVATNRNDFAACSGTAFGTAEWFTAGSLGSAPNISRNPIRPAMATTVDVQRAGIVQFVDTTWNAATTITAFLGGVVGQEITLLATNGNVTIQHGAGTGTANNIRTHTGANMVLALNRGYRFMFYGGVWSPVY